MIWKAEGHKVPLTGKIWKVSEHKGWGDNISVRNSDHLTYYSWTGHTTPRVQTGDLFEFVSKSGSTYRFCVYEVTAFSDPPDQWFAKTSKIPVAVMLQNVGKNEEERKLDGTD